MLEMNLLDFTHNEEFPFFIQYWVHIGNMLMYSHKDFSELVIVTEGSARHIVDNESYVISKGDVFVISGDTEHGFPDAQDLRICNIMFDPSFWTKNCYDIKKTAGFQALFVLEPQYSKQSNFRSRLKLGAGDYVKIFSICDDMQSNYTERGEGWQTLFISGFLRLAAELSQLYLKTSDSSDPMINLAKAIAHIESYYTQNIEVAELAAISNYSVRQFIRIFKKIYDCKPTEYIRRLRMKNACILLKSGSLLITDIAIRCGYGDGNYFIRVFTKDMRITPREYRKRNQALE